MGFCPKFYRQLSKICKNSPKVIMNKRNKTAPVSLKNMPTTDVQQTKVKSLKETKGFEILQTPIKSESDKKEYRVIQLDNGLIACLISDKSPILKHEVEESECEDSESGEEDSMSGESDKGAGKIYFIFKNHNF